MPIYTLKFYKCFFVYIVCATNELYDIDQRQGAERASLLGLGSWTVVGNVVG